MTISPPETLYIERCMSKACFIMYNLHHPGQDYSRSQLTNLVNYSIQLINCWAVKWCFKIGSNYINRLFEALQGNKTINFLFRDFHQQYCFNGLVSRHHPFWCVILSGVIFIFILRAACTHTGGRYCTHDISIVFIF